MARRVVVALDADGGGDAVADVDHAGVLARADQHVRRLGGQAAAGGSATTCRSSARTTSPRTWPARGGSAAARGSSRCRPPRRRSARGPGGAARLRAPVRRHRPQPTWRADGASDHAANAALRTMTPHTMRRAMAMTEWHTTKPHVRRAQGGPGGGPEPGSGGAQLPRGARGPQAQAGPQAHAGVDAERRLERIDAELRRRRPAQARCSSSRSGSTSPPSSRRIGAKVDLAASRPTSSRRPRATATARASPTRAWRAARRGRRAC